MGSWVGKILSLYHYDHTITGQEFGVFFCIIQYTVTCQACLITATVKTETLECFQIDCSIDCNGISAVLQFLLHDIKE